MSALVAPAVSCYDRLIMDVAGTVYSYAALALEQTCPAAARALPAAEPPQFVCSELGQRLRCIIDAATGAPMIPPPAAVRQAVDDVCRALFSAPAGIPYEVPAAWWHTAAGYLCSIALAVADREDLVQLDVAAQELGMIRQALAEHLGLPDALRDARPAPLVFREELPEDTGD